VVAAARTLARILAAVAEQVEVELAVLTPTARLALQTPEAVVERVVVTPEPARLVDQGSSLSKSPLQTPQHSLAVSPRPLPRLATTRCIRLLPQALATR